MGFFLFTFWVLSLEVFLSSFYSTNLKHYLENYLLLIQNETWDSVAQETMLKENNQHQEPHKKIAAPSFFQLTAGESMFLQGRWGVFPSSSPPLAKNNSNFLDMREHLVRQGMRRAQRSNVACTNSTASCILGSAEGYCSSNRFAVAITRNGLQSAWGKIAGSFYFKEYVCTLSI